MDVFSFQNFRTDFASIDVSGLYGTPGALTQVSGTLRQEAHFSQLVTTAGVFYSFGKGGDWSDHNPLSAGTGAHAGRWELSFQTGGVIGGNHGSPDFGHCTAD